MTARFVCPLAAGNGRRDGTGGDTMAGPGAPGAAPRADAQAAA
ncbi:MULTISPECIES: hypothetical protein [unclassified Burkholderia]|nr:MULTISPECIES: hypothetical protein [unclassified Burkholderia]MCR4469538.1 hypothetical protein [Burkholderia sp. SCN-KJ]